jgi:hypothetical protein
MIPIRERLERICETGKNRNLVVSKYREGSACRRSWLGRGAQADRRTTRGRWISDESPKVRGFGAKASERAAKPERGRIRGSEHRRSPRGPVWRLARSPRHLDPAGCPEDPSPEGSTGAQDRMARAWTEPSRGTSGRSWLPQTEVWRPTGSPRSQIAEDRHRGMPDRSEHPRACDRDRGAHRDQQRGEV